MSKISTKNILKKIFKSKTNKKVKKKVSKKKVVKAKKAKKIISNQIKNLVKKFSPKTTLIQYTLNFSLPPSHQTLDNLIISKTN